MLWVCADLLEEDEEEEEALCFLMAMWVYESGCCLSIKPFFFFFFNETPSFVLKLKGVVTGIYTKRNLPISIVVQRRPKVVPI